MAFGRGNAVTDNGSQAPPIDQVTSSTDPVRRTRQWLPAVGAGFVGALVTTIGMWQPSLWSDEAATITAASRPLPDLWRMLQSIDLVHGFYYLLMHGWIQLFGDSAFALRAPSALAIGVATGFVYLLGARLGGRTMAVTSVAVFVLIPRIFWASGEARSYAFTAAAAAAATAVLLTAALRDTRRCVLIWALYSVLMVVGVLFNLYFGLLFLAHGISIVLDRRVTSASRRAWVLAAVSASAVCLPFLCFAYGQAGQLSDRAFGVKDLLQNVAVNQWFLGDTPTTTTGAGRTTFSLSHPDSWWMPAAVVLAALGWGLMLWAAWHDWRSRSSHAGAKDGHGSVTTVWTAPWLLVPTAVIGLYSVAVSPMYGPRYLTFAAPAVAVLISHGILTINRKSIRAAVICLLVLAVLPILVSQRQLYAKNSSDWVGVANYLQPQKENGQGVYFAPRYDVASATVGQTTRGISVAYPEAFTGLQDVTLIETPDAAGNLVGRSRYLSQSLAELADVNTLWVIRRVDAPVGQVAEDDRVLSDAGFDQTSEWKGPLDEVSRFDRVR